MRVSRWVDWLFPPVARGRVAVLRTLIYSFIFIDVFLTTAWVSRHADVAGELYNPLFFGRVLPLPTPTPLVVTLTKTGVLIAAAIAVSGKFPRIAGAATFFLYTEWMFIAMSYGKVDHDRFAFLVALAVLPTVGRARWGDREPDEGAGWAVRGIQIAVVLTYFLAAFAKFRFGGFDWVTGATLLRAVIRRGTSIGEPLADFPGLLLGSQYALIAFELASPLLLMRGRIGTIFLGLAVSFHLVTFATIGIIFLPHVVCLAAFLPLERLQVPKWIRTYRSSRREPIVSASAGSLSVR